MKQYCWCISLEVGATFSAVAFLVIAIAEMFLEKMIELVEVEKAVVLLHAIVFMAGAVMLLIGILIVDVICIYLFVLFGSGAIIAKIAAILVIITIGQKTYKEIIWIILYGCVLFVIHFYTLLVAWSLGKKLWQQSQQHIQMPVSLHRWGHHRHHPVLGV